MKYNGDIKTHTRNLPTILIVRPVPNTVSQNAHNSISSILKCNSIHDLRKPI